MAEECVDVKGDGVFIVRFGDVALAGFWRAGHGAVRGGASRQARHALRCGRRTSQNRASADFQTRYGSTERSDAVSAATTAAETP